MLRYATSAPTVKEMMKLREKISNCLEAAALATGCKVKNVNSFQMLLQRKYGKRERGEKRTKLVYDQ